MPNFYRFTALFLALLFSSSLAAARASTPHKTENVIFIMTDGLRWQEVFSGVDPFLMPRRPGFCETIKQAYWRDTPEARRSALMPFVWSVMAQQGQIYGNRFKGSSASVTNGRNFSYPGYSETLCGFADPRINSNMNYPNANVSVLEWLHSKKKFKGQVAAFGAWDTFKGILNTKRCGFLLNAGYDPLTAIKGNAAIDMLNRIKKELPRRWPAEPYDTVTFNTALEYLKVKKPKVLFLSLAETDSWAHMCNYKEYLDAAHRVDGYVKTLWETVQSMPEYKGKTTLVFMPDHGRGDGFSWKDHGSTVKGSEAVWMAFMGPDTPPLGERTNVPGITQNQVAATVAGLFGEDYVGDVVQAGSPIREVFASAKQIAFGTTVPAKRKGVATVSNR